MKRIFQFFRAKFRSIRVIAKISLRNLVRQFRRNLLLGIGIALGMCILLVTTAYTNGLTDILFNRVMVYMTGHIGIEMRESTSVRTIVMRDRPRIMEAVRANVDGIKQIDDQVGVFARAIGNGKTGFAMLIGIPEDSDFGSTMNLKAGDVKDLHKKDVYPSAVIYEGAAEDLNVGLNDILKMKFETIYKQAQFAHFRVAGIIESENLFMDVAAFVDLNELRSLLNLKPEETLGLAIVTDYPEESEKVIAEANRLYAALTPGAAGIAGRFSVNGRESTADLFALMPETHPDTLALVKEKLAFVSGRLEDLIAREDGVIVNETLAASLGAGIGSKALLDYKPKYGSETVLKEFVITGIVKDPAGFGPLTAFAHEGSFYGMYFWNIPETPAPVSREAALFNALLPEWELLPRTADTDSYMKKMQKLSRDDWKGTRLDVSTMFETGSMIVDIQRGLNTISMVAVLILFFVILIGVVNTMRMSIRERTREIGTSRAIGMQRGDVRSIFVFEILFLSIFACVVGVLIGLGLIGILSAPTFDLRDNPFSMFFVEKHLYFVPTPASILSNALTIILIAFIIAFFTARRAAKMRAADALRHYE